MRTIQFTIKARTVESYLYGGYLFLLMEDGRILYVSYPYLINQLCERYPRYAKLIQLAFLHNEYFRSKAASLLLGIDEVRQAISQLWDKAAQEIRIEIDFASIENDCHSMGTWQDMPLDVYMYDMRMFVASRSGLMESRLRPDFESPDYSLHPTPFEKCFDSKVIAVSARAGKVVLSADKEGLLYGDALVKDACVRIDDRDHIAGRSLRTGWSHFDLINYSSANAFQYLRNTTGLLEPDSKERFRFGDVVEKKRIVDFAASSFDRDAMMSRSGIPMENIRYCFNVSGKSFFLMDNGIVLNSAIKVKEEENAVYYSPVVKRVPYERGEISRRKPLKVAEVPNGYVISFFDKVVLYQKENERVLEESPAFNIRAYMGSKNYRDIVTVTKEEGVSFHSIDVLDTVPKVRAIRRG